MIKWFLNLFKSSKTEEDRMFGAVRSSKWPSVRKQFLINNSECAACMTKEDLEVHHRIPVHIRPEKELDSTNLITLCSVHHFWIGHLGSWKSYNRRVREDSNLTKIAIQNRP